MTMDDKTNVLLDLVRRILLVAQDENDLMTFCNMVLNNTVDNPVERFISGLESVESLGFKRTFPCENNYANCFNKTFRDSKIICPSKKEN